MTPLQQIAADRLLGRLTEAQAAHARAKHLQPCQICGKPTDTPQECAACQIGEDARQVRRADR